jgi:hypothetical protein
MMDECPKCERIKKLAQIWSKLCLYSTRDCGDIILAILNEPEPKDPNATFYKEGYGKNKKEKDVKAV